MIRLTNIILCLCCLTACSDLHLSSMSYPSNLQPIYLKNSDSFADSNIIANLTKQLQDLDIAITNNDKDAKTIITISDTQHTTAKVTNSVITSDTAYYNNKYSTTLAISHPQQKNKHYQQYISTHEQVAILENQNIFNNYHHSPELEDDLIERVMLAILLRAIVPASN